MSTERVEEFIEAYVPTIIAWVFMGSLLALPKYSMPNALLQSAAILFWSYGGHVLAHQMSSTGPLRYLNPHVFLHHDKTILMSRPLELLIEALVNFFGFFIIFIIQKLCNFEVFSPSLLIGAAFLYITVHILDYSIKGNPNHGQHHKKHFCNYDPEFLDALFGTRCEPEKPYSNISGEIPHAVFAFSLAGLLKIYMKLD
jgi:hypothetical protein